MYNIFIEGIQGAGKSTLLQNLHTKLVDYKVYQEGELSPIELAWCAYMTEDNLKHVIEKYPALEKDINAHTMTEGTMKIVAYTKIITENLCFYKDMEQYEIYNGNIPYKKFEEIIFRRYEKWSGEKQIHECVLFQNLIDCMILYYKMSEEEIIHFYEKLYTILKYKNIKLIYIDVLEIQQTIDEIKKERVDENGVEIWYSLAIQFLEESPYGKANQLKGMEGFIQYLEKRIRLEHRIIHTFFEQEAILIKSKKYDISSLIEKLNEKQH